MRELGILGTESGAKVKGLARGVEWSGARDE